MTDDLWAGIFFSIAIGMAVQYFIIRGAVISAMNKKLNKNTSSNDDILVIQTKLLVEIAKKNNVDQEKIDEIFGFNPKVLKPKF